MTLHRLIVSLMLAWSLVLALLYVSSFPVEGEFASSPGLSGQQAGPDDAATAPARRMDGPAERGVRTESPRHLA